MSSMGNKRVKALAINSSRKLSKTRLTNEPKNREERRRLKHAQRRQK